MRFLIPFFILFFCFSLFFVSGELFFSEVMYTPVDDIEWLEFYVTETFNISGLIIRDNYQTDTVECCYSDCDEIIQANNFFLIFAKNKILNNSGFNCENNSCFFYCIDDSAIGNGLGNLGDTILVYKNEESLINFSYNLSIKKGNTLSFINNTWLETFPTPFEKNQQDKLDESFESPITNLSQITNISAEIPKQDIDLNADFEIVFMENIFFVNKRYDNFFKIINKNYPKVKEKNNLTLIYNISNNNLFFYNEINVSFVSYTTKTSNFIFNTSGFYTICGEIFVNDTNVSNNRICKEIYVRDSNEILCNVSFDISIEKEIFVLGDKVEFYFILSNNSISFEIEYWIENSNLELIKDKQITKNTNKKSFTPNKEGLYLIKANLKTQCNNTNRERIENKTRAFYVNKLYEKESKLEIKDLILKENYIQLKLYIYKGNTTKKAIYVSFDDKKTTFYADEKYNEYLFTFPLYFNGCGNKSLSIEGLEQKIIKEIFIECVNEDKESNKEQIKENQKKETIQKAINKQYYLINFTKEITNDFYAIIQINNNDNQSHKYTISFYIYNATKRYSEVLNEEIVINAKTTEKILLENFVNKEVNGIIKMKIKILRDDRKTPYEFTEQVVAFFKNEKNTKNELISKIENNLNNIENYENGTFDYVETNQVETVVENNISYFSENKKISESPENKNINENNIDGSNLNTNKTNKITGFVFFNKEKKTIYALFFVFILVGIYFFSKISKRLVK